MDKNKVTEARKYRIFPTKEQEETIKFYIECNRLMWNEMLSRVYKPITDKLEKEESKEGLYHYLNHMDYKEQKKLVKGLNSVTPKKVYIEKTKLKYADVALYGYTKKMLKISFDNHFKNPKHFKMPKFKGFKDTLYSGSYSTSAGNFCYFKKENIFKISKVGDVEIKNHYESAGRLFKVTITRTPTDEYFVSLFFEQDKHNKIFEKTGKEVGLDFNVDSETAIALSDGTFIKRPRVKKLLSKIDWENHKLGKKRDKLKKEWAFYVKEHKDNPISFSEFLLNKSNYQKNRMKLNKLYKRIKNIFSYWIKTTASKLSEEYDTVVIEDLRAANMMKNHKLARALSQSHFRELRVALEYKMNWSNKKLITVDPKYTTQTCSTCDYVLEKNERLTLKDRKWTCPGCGVEHVRDTNAAKNILKKFKNSIDKLVLI